MVSRIFSHASLDLTQNIPHSWKNNVMGKYEFLSLDTIMAFGTAAGR
jgi:hypothetical protein